jgi:hypothetical protein
MNAKLESVLTTLTVGLLVMIMVMIASNVFGQDRFLCAMGTTMQEARQIVHAFPQVQKEESLDRVSLSAEGLQVEYIFEEGTLSQLQLVRRFHNAQVAATSLESHLMYIERTGATVVTLSDDPKHKVYCAMAKEAAYELEFVASGSHLQQLKIRSWRRGELMEPTAQEAGLQLEMQRKFD